MSTYKLSSHYNAVIWFVIMICILFFFSTPVDDLLNTLLVKPLFSKFNNTVFSNVLLIISSFAFSIWLIKHSSSYFLIKLAVFVFTFYCTQRWNLFWKFHNLTIISKIYVWDIISLSLVVPALK